MDGETTFNIVDQSEMFSSFFDGDNICKLRMGAINICFSSIPHGSTLVFCLKRTHETSWEIDVGADFAVDFDQALHDNLCNISVCLKYLDRCNR